MKQPADTIRYTRGAKKLTHVLKNHEQMRIISLHETEYKMINKKK